MLKKTSMTRLTSVVPAPAEIAGGEAEDAADEHGGADGDRRDVERDARAVDHAAQDVAAEAVRAHPGLVAGRGLEELEVLLVGGHRREKPGEQGHEHDQDGDDEAAEHDRASEGPADPPTEARHLTGGIGSHEHGLACELQRPMLGGPVGACQGRTPGVAEWNCSRRGGRGRAPRVPCPACQRHRRRCLGEVAPSPVDEAWIDPCPHRADLGGRRRAARRPAVGHQLPGHEGPHGRDGPRDPRRGPVARRAGHPGWSPPACEARGGRQRPGSYPRSWGPA